MAERLAAWRHRLHRLPWLYGGHSCRRGRPRPPSSEMRKVAAAGRDRNSASVAAAGEAGRKGARVLRAMGRVLLLFLSLPRGMMVDGRRETSLLSLLSPSALSLSFSLPLSLNSSIVWVVVVAAAKVA
jgi:hypothetical protein